MTQCEVMDLFPTKIIKFKFSYHDSYWFDDIEKSVNLPEGWVIPLNSSFPWIQDNDSFISSRIRDHLMCDIKEDLSNIFSNFRMPTNIDYKDFWYNVYHEGQGQERHDHISKVGNVTTYWSGIYYNKNSSPTTFFRSDNMHRTQFFPGIENCELKEAYYQNFSVGVEDGDILLFPPYLEHCIDPISLKEPNMRLTFAFNLKLV